MEFLRDHVGEDLLTWFGHSARGPGHGAGPTVSLADLRTDRSRRARQVQAAADARVKDWARYSRQAAEFHLKNARAWANAATGQDLADQIDPDFTLGPRAFAAP